MEAQKSSNCGLATGFILVSLLAIGAVCYYEGYLPMLFKPKGKDDKEKAPDKTGGGEPKKEEPSLTKEEVHNAPQAEVKKAIEETGKGFEEGKPIEQKPSASASGGKKIEVHGKKLNLSADGKSGNGVGRRKKKFNNDWGDIHF